MRLELYNTDCYGTDIGAIFTHNPLKAPIDVAFVAVRQGTFLPISDLAIWHIARKYHEDCEAYDREVCTGTKDDVAVPMNVVELGLINIHARARMKQADAEAAVHSCSHEELMKAIRLVSREMD